MKKDFDERALLDLFVSKWSPIFKWTETPFEYGGFVFATDRNVMIRIDKRLVKWLYLKYFDFKISIPDKLPLRTKYELRDIERLLESIPKERVCVTKEEEISCKECEGTGFVTWEYTDKEGRFHELEEKCPVCEGDGYIAEEEKVETDEFQLPDMCPVWVHGGYLQARYLEVLQKAMKLLDVERVFLCEDLPSMLLFQLDEGIHVAIAKMVPGNAKCYELKGKEELV